MPRSRPLVTVPLDTTLPATIPAPIRHREHARRLRPIREALPARSKGFMRLGIPPVRVLARLVPRVSLLSTVRPARRPEAMPQPGGLLIRLRDRATRPRALVVFSRALRRQRVRLLTLRRLPLPMAVAAIPPHRRLERHPRILPRADTTVERRTPAERRHIPAARTHRAAPVAVQASRPAVARRVLIRSRKLTA